MRGIGKIQGEIQAPGSIVLPYAYAIDSHYDFFIPGPENIGSTQVNDISPNAKNITSLQTPTLNIRANSTLYATGTYLKRVVDDGYYWLVTFGGTTASSEPAAYGTATADGGAITDGTASVQKVTGAFSIPGYISCGTPNIATDISPISPVTWLQDWNFAAGKSLLFHFTALRTSALLGGSGISTFFAQRRDGTNPGIRFGIARGNQVTVAQNRIGLTVQSRSGGDGSGTTTTFDVIDTTPGISSLPQLIAGTPQTIILLIDAVSKKIWYYGINQGDSSETVCTVANGNSCSTLTNTVSARGFHWGSAPNTNTSVQMSISNIGGLIFNGSLPSNITTAVKHIARFPAYPLPQGFLA